MNTEEIKEVMVGCGNSGVRYFVVSEDMELYHFYQCHKIKDNSFSDEKMHNHIYTGFDKNGNKLFEIINQPITIGYKRELIEESKSNIDDDIPF